MRELIDLFVDERIGVPQLVGDLESLLEAMEEPDPWRNAIAKQWSVLEDAYAASLDRGDTVISPQYQAIFNSAVNAIRAILENVPDQNNAESL